MTKIANGGLVKQIGKALAGVGMGLVLMLGITGDGLNRSAYAADCKEGQVKTAVLGQDGCYDVDDHGEVILVIISRVLTILTYGVGAIGVLGITVAGVHYTMSAGNAGAAAKARTRIVEVLIGLLCWGLMYSFLEWLLPGGIFNSGII